VKIAVNDDNDEAYILELNSETDFVSKNEKFQALADSIMKVVVDNKPANLEELMVISMETGTVQEVVDNFSGTIGEKLVVKNFEILNANGASASAYSHAGGKIGAIVSFDKKIDVDLARDIAMHVAASAPTCINPEDLEQKDIDKEKEIYTEQLKKEGKPEQIIEKILVGKIDKYYTEVCLMKQEYIKDDKQSIENVLGGAKVIKFVRYSL
ncbi:MAG: translation elongation factor Ts, partial [Candidatus Heimdallarchaeaceae archaeon]